MLRKTFRTAVSQAILCHGVRGTVCDMLNFTASLLPAAVRPRLLARRDGITAVAALATTLSLWAFVYVAPAIAHDVPPLLLAGLRYGVHGLVSLAVLRRVGAPEDARTWLRAARHAATGFIGYYVLVTTAVRVGGATLVVLALAASPVVYTLAGRPGVPIRRLALPIALILAGGVTATVTGPVGDTTVPAMLLSVALVGGALGIWTWYGLDNAKVVADPATDLTRWTATTGVAAGLLSLPLIAFGMTSLPAAGPGISIRSLLVILVIGLGSTTIANRTWNTASRVLSPSIVGPLLVLETVIALTYAHLLDGVMPSGRTLLGEVMLLAGAASCLLVVTRARRSRTAAATGAATGATSAEDSLALGLEQA